MEAMANTMSHIMAIVLVLCALVSAALAILRFVLGPDDADRIVALDILFAAGIVLCAAAALYSGRMLYLDVAIGVALIGFIATLAWARVLERSAQGGPETQAPRVERQLP